MFSQQSLPGQIKLREQRKLEWGLSDVIIHVGQDPILVKGVILVPQALLDKASDARNSGGFSPVQAHDDSLNHNLASEGLV